MNNHNLLKQLRMFCHVTQTGNISRAATLMGLSQPSASLLIKSLEKDLKTQLFERRGPKITPSPYGVSLYKMAQPAVEAMDRLPENFLSSIGDINSGKINIGAEQSTILYLLPRYVTAFHQDYDKVKIHLKDCSGDSGLHLLRSSDIDFLVGTLAKVPDDLDYHPIFNYRTMLITPVDHPLSMKRDIRLEDIAQYPLILPPGHLSTRTAIDQLFRQYNLSYDIALEAEGWEVIKKYVSTGLGISIVTELCITGDDELSEIALDHYFPSRSYGIIQRKGKLYSLQDRLFIELLDKNFFSQLDES